MPPGGLWLWCPPFCFPHRTADAAAAERQGGGQQQEDAGLAREQRILGATARTDAAASQGLPPGLQHHDGGRRAQPGLRAARLPRAARGGGGPAAGRHPAGGPLLPTRQPAGGPLLPTRQPAVGPLLQGLQPRGPAGRPPGGAPRAALPPSQRRQARGREEEGRGLLPPRGAQATAGVRGGDGAGVGPQQDDRGQRGPGADPARRGAAAKAAEAAEEEATAAATTATTEEAATTAAEAAAGAAATAPKQ